MTAEFHVSFDDGSNQWIFGCKVARYLDVVHSFLVSLSKPEFELLNRCETKLVRDMMGIALQQREAVREALEAVKKQEQSAATGHGPIRVGPIDTEAINIAIVDSHDLKTSVTMKRTTMLLHLFNAYAAHETRYAVELRFMYDGRRMQGDMTPNDYGMTSGDRIEVMGELRGGKPVIYLYPTTSIDCKVEVDLSDECEFTDVYPVISQACANKTSWHVNAFPGGALIIANDGKRAL